MALKPLCGSQKNPISSPLPMGFIFFHQNIIHGPLVCCPWKPFLNPICSSMGTLHSHVHANLVDAVLFDLAPLSTTLLGFFQDHLVLWASLIGYAFVWALSTNFVTLLYTTICYGTTCLGDKTLGRIQFSN